MKIRKADKKSKAEELTPKTLHHIELLKRYYDIDVENRVIYLELHYEKVSDVLANEVTYKDHPHFTDDIIGKVTEIIETFPYGFDVDLSLKFDDYEGFDPDVLLTSFKDSLLMYHFSSFKQKRYTWLISGLMIVIGVALCAFRLFIIGHNWTTDDGIVQEIIDIAAWVFIWEAVSLIFIEESDKSNISKNIIPLFSNISFVDKGGKALLSVNREELIKTWSFESKKHRNGRALLLIGGSGCLSFAVIKAFECISELFIMCNPPEGTNFGSVSSDFILSAATFLLFVVAGIGAINVFRERGKLRKAVPFCAWVMFLFDVAFIVVTVLQITVFKQNEKADISKFIASSCVSLIVTIIYFIGFSITKASSLSRRKAK